MALDLIGAPPHAGERKPSPSPSGQHTGSPSQSLSTQSVAPSASRATPSAPGTLVVTQARDMRRTSTPAPSASTTRSWAGVEHAVHFYEDDESLAGRVATFLADGLVAGERAVLIASAARRQIFDDAEAPA